MNGTTKDERISKRAKSMIHKEYQNIPSDWDIVKMENIATINPRKPQKIKYNGEERDIDPTDKVTFLGMSDVSEASLIATPQSKNYKEVSTGYTGFRENDILIAKITPCFENGKGALGKNLINGIGFGSTEFHVIRTDEEINEKWLHYLTSSYFFRKRGELNMQGSAGQQRIPTDYVSTYFLPKPPKKEQDEIVNIISTWDAVISTLKKLIKAKKRYKKGLMQQLLSGKKRFPEFEEEEWQEVKLGEIAEVISSNLDKKVKEGQKEALLCNYMDVYENAIIDSSIPFMKSTASKREQKKYELKEDDVIITKDSETADDIASAAVVKNLNMPVLCGYHLAILRPKKEIISGDFLAKQIMTFEYRKQFFKMANGATRYGLRISDIKSAKFHIPSLKEQKKVSSFINCINSEITLLIKELELFKKQKEGLMQQLLTGKVRVKEKQQSHVKF